MKKLLSALMCTILLLCMFAVPVLAAEQSGSCGANLTYSFSDGTLIISGSGQMDNTVYDETNYKSYDWVDEGFDIKSLVLESGVTSIGAFAFEGFSNLTGSVNIPDSVTSIGTGAFRFTGLTSVYIPVSVTKIEMGAFFECPLTDVFYDGTKAQWDSIDIASDYNDELTKATMHFTDSIETKSSATDAQKPLDTELTASSGDEITVLLNGKAVAFDQPPIIVDGRTMVPMRAIFEALGATVQWDNEAKSVISIRDSTAVGMVIGEPVVIKRVGNDDPVTIEIDKAPVIVNGRTLVPVRAVAESFDCNVSWDQDTKTVSIIDINSIE